MQAKRHGEETGNSQVEKKKENILALKQNKKNLLL